jgi:ubiquinone/menaquinone biosynthesis C-methylase UbiE
MTVMKFREHIPCERALDESLSTTSSGTYKFTDAIHEVFEHQRYLGASIETQHAIMDGMSQLAHDSETNYPWEHYFTVPPKDHIRGRVLDVGSFVGGRTVAWAERYGLDTVHGVDISEEYAAAASQFSRSRQITGHFLVGCAEKLPYADETFDTVLSFNTFEHVQDARKALQECHRVLRRGGKMVVTFPGFFQPLAHHLDMVTGTPCIHWLFSRDTLLAAYNRIIDERGEQAAWYGRARRDPYAWEAGNSINGTTARAFRSWIAESGFNIFDWAVRPFGSIGRNAPGSQAVRSILRALQPLARLPGFEEVLLHRVSCVLHKPA